jgi:hypothetical protein
MADAWHNHEAAVRHRRRHGPEINSKLMNYRRMASLPIMRIRSANALFWPEARRDL